MVREIDGRTLILKVFNENIGKDFTVTELSEKLNIAVATISKYILLLEAEGKVEIRIVGNAYLVKMKGDNNG